MSDKVKISVDKKSSSNVTFVFDLPKIAVPKGFKDVIGEVLKSVEAELNVNISIASPKTPYGTQLPDKGFVEKTITIPKPESVRATGQIYPSDFSNTIIKDIELIGAEFENDQFQDMINLILEKINLKLAAITNTSHSDYFTVKTELAASGNITATDIDSFNTFHQNKDGLFQFGKTETDKDKVDEIVNIYKNHKEVIKFDGLMEVLIGRKAGFNTYITLSESEAKLIKKRMDSLILKTLQELITTSTIKDELKIAAYIKQMLVAREQFYKGSDMEEEAKEGFFCDSSEEFNKLVQTYYNVSQAATKVDKIKAAAKVPGAKSTKPSDLAQAYSGFDMQDLPESLDIVPGVKLTKVGITELLKVVDNPKTPDAVLSTEVKSKTRIILKLIQTESLDEAVRDFLKQEEVSETNAADLLKRKSNRSPYYSKVVVSSIDEAILDSTNNLFVENKSGGASIADISVYSYLQKILKPTNKTSLVFDLTLDVDQDKANEFIGDLSIILKKFNSILEKCPDGSPEKIYFQGLIETVESRIKDDLEKMEKSIKTITTVPTPDELKKKEMVIVEARNLLLNYKKPGYTPVEIDFKLRGSVDIGAASSDEELQKNIDGILKKRIEAMKAIRKNIENNIRKNKKEEQNLRALTKTRSGQNIEDNLSLLSADKQKDAIKVLQQLNVDQLYKAKIDDQIAVAERSTRSAVEGVRAILFDIPKDVNRSTNIIERNRRLSFFKRRMRDRIVNSAGSVIGGGIFTTGAIAGPLGASIAFAGVAGVIGGMLSGRLKQESNRRVDFDNKNIGFLTNIVGSIGKEDRLARRTVRQDEEDRIQSTATEKIDALDNELGNVNVIKSGLVNIIESMSRIPPVTINYEESIETWKQYDYIWDEFSAITGMSDGNPDGVFETIDTINETVRSYQDTFTELRGTKDANIQTEKEKIKALSARTKGGIWRSFGNFFNKHILKGSPGGVLKARGIGGP